MEEVRFLTCGDCAITVAFRQEIREETNQKIRYLEEKLQKANKELTKSNKTLSKTVDLMKEVINEMAKHIHLSGDYECLNKECEDEGNIDCEECIKEYFTKKAEKEGK